MILNIYIYIYIYIEYIDIDKAGEAKVLERYDLYNSEIKVEKEDNHHEIEYIDVSSQIFGLNRTKGQICEPIFVLNNGALGQYLIFVLNWTMGGVQTASSQYRCVLESVRYIGLGKGWL